MPQRMLERGHEFEHVTAAMKFARTSLIAIAAMVGIFAATTLFLLPRLQHRDAPCVTRDFEGSRFVVCTFDARRHDLRLYSRAANGGYLRSFENLQRELGRATRNVRFAMNAGMYNDRGAPIGLYVANAEEQHAISLNRWPRQLPPQT